MGNKCDLGEEDRQISVKMGEEFGEMEFPFLETSAKDDIRVGECFELLAKEILSKFVMIVVVIVVIIIVVVVVSGGNSDWL